MRPPGQCGEVCHRPAGLEDVRWRARQQADITAAGIAAMAGADVTPEPLRPLIRAVLHTGRQPLYITARIDGDRVESEVTTEPASPADEKIAAEELGPFLRSLD